MSPGKAIAQAGHAFLSSYLDATTSDPLQAKAYAHLAPGTKITLQGGAEGELLDLHHRLKALGLPCCLIIDSGHIELPDFDGSPVVTALGVGPLLPKTARKHLSSFPLWRGKGGDA